MPLYKDPKIGTGMGIKSFNAKVLQKYIGINRVEVKAVFEKQTPYQLTKAPPRPINKPVVALYPNGRWEADLINMAQYSGHNKRKTYIMTVIDVFLCIGIGKTVQSISDDICDKIIPAKFEEIAHKRKRRRQPVFRRYHHHGAPHIKNI